MSTFRRRRAPDPNRPGTIYRSKPRFGRVRGLAAGPPYFGGSRAGGSGAAGGVGGDGQQSYVDDGGATPAAGVGNVYREHGGRPEPAGQYGNVIDDAGHDQITRGAPGRAGAGAVGAGQGGAGQGGAGAARQGAGGYPGASHPGGRAGGPGYSGYPPSGGGPGGAVGGAARRPSMPRLRLPRLSLLVLVLVIVVIGYPLLLGLTAWKNVGRVDALAPAHAVADTADTPGRTYLVVGSDSRADLTAAERRRLGTGRAAGQRTDTIMLLHVPAGSGPTVLISVPRDSYVPIPGHGQNKINAAYAFGGAPLLVRTLEQATGVRIDEYVETGLGGFANVVDALGGVVLCPKFAMKDHDAHINLKKGCQQMDGKTALGYARARHSDPRGDLGRVERQRETLAAIAKKTLSPSTLIQPWRAFPAARAGGGALTVDQSTTPLGLAHFVLAMRAVAGGTGLSLTVPIGNPNLQTPAGSSVQWDRTKALQLFHDLKADDTEAIKPIAAAQKQK